MTNESKYSKLKLHLKKYWMNYTILVSLVFSLLVFFFVKPSYYNRGKANMVIIDDSFSTSSSSRTVVINKCYPVLICLAAVSAFVCLILAYVKKNVALVGALTLILPPLCFGAYVVNGIAPWLEFGSVSDSKGIRYCFLDSSFLQGQILAIGQMEWDNIFIRKYKILVSTNGDSPRSYIFMLRPQGSKDFYGQMYLANNEWLLGVRSSNELYMAYNLKTGKAYGHAGIGGVSPFLMINRDTKIKQGDSPGSYSSNYINKEPQLEQMKEAINHPNAEVRRLANVFLKSKNKN